MNNEVIDFANKTLMSIGEAFLTSTEETQMPQTLNLDAVYNALFSILQARKVPQVTLDLLNACAIADQVNLPTDVVAKHFGSNIALGFGVD